MVLKASRIYNSQCASLDEPLEELRLKQLRAELAETRVHVQESALVEGNRLIRTCR